LKILIDAYRKLNMPDLAVNAEKVYELNYPGDAKLVEAPKRPWWKLF